MLTKEITYIPYTRFILAWVAFSFVLGKLPIPPFLYANIDSISGILYMVITLTYYGSRTEKFLLSNYRDSCAEAMRKIHQIPPWHEKEGKIYFSMRGFDYVVRKKIFEPRDAIIRMIYRNNIYSGIFAGIIWVKSGFILALLYFRLG